MIPTPHSDSAEAVSHLYGAMAEVLGQKILLGLGVVLAWLVLFHLLVNIWLLCVFTSLLVVLAGWLGSQAVLESNNVVHLERFITLEEIPPSADDEHDLDEEIFNIVRKIIRDFVTSWYSTVSTQSAFEKEVEQALISMAMELKMRARLVNRKLTQRILDLFGCHMQDYITAKEMVSEHRTPPTERRSSDKEQLWEAYSAFATPHLAMTNGTVQVNYTRAVVDLLLHVLVPPPHLETHTGRFVVRELITCNVMLPFIKKLCDPDWLNSLLIEVCGCSSKPSYKQVATESLTSSPPLEVTHLPQNNEVPPLRAEYDMFNNAETAMPESASCHVIDSEEVDCPLNSTEDEEPTLPFIRHYMRGRKSNPFYQEIDSDPDSPFADRKQISTDSLVMIGQEQSLYAKQKESITSCEISNSSDPDDICPGPVEASCPRVLVNSQPVEHPSLIRVAEGTLNVTSLQDLETEGFSPLVTPARELLLGVEHSGLVNPSELTEVSPLQSSSPMRSFSFEPLGSPEGPVIIQNLRITGTITAKEHRGTGSHPYTLYTIKYETAMACENTGNLQLVAYHMVNRRYSEFLNLQTRLEEKTDLRKLIKGVKGPKKIFPDMPFGNMDSDKIEARKGLLETFVKQLCTIPEIANSEEMQEFLALNTDARIAFVKKPFIVSRIDKIVVNAIVDTLKTAFPRSEPQSPTEDEGEVDGLKISADKKSKYDSKTQNNTERGVIQVALLLQDLSPQFEHQSINSFFFSCLLSPLCLVKLKLCVLHVSGAASETTLTEVVLNILCLLMKTHWSWLCTENIQKTIRLLFGTLINRWLDVSVANLMCTRYWVAYLQVIQEAVWPGGSLPTTPQHERSQQQKDSTRQQALHRLMSLLPGTCTHKVSTKIDQYIVRILAYHRYTDIDIALQNLLQTLSKSTEKLLA
uniref:Uncharacterized protein n=1 Tax=Mola mola TaxID=94237 RepID=A0A3Q4BU82_MOLML